MVSSAPAPLVNPPVSYAERVKRAHSPKLVRNSSLDFPAVPTASGASYSVSPRSNAASQLPKPINPVEVAGRSQPTASDFPGLFTEISSRSTAKDHNEQANPPKTAPAVNVWTERMKGQVALTHIHQAQKQPRVIATPSDAAPLVPSRSKSIVAGSLSHSLNVPSIASSASTSRSSPSQAASLAGNDDDHDPFVVRFPPHLSRHSSSKSIPVVNESGNAEPRKPPSPTNINGLDKPGVSEGHADAYSPSDLSRKNSGDSTQHQSDLRLPATQMSQLNNRNISEINSTSSQSVSHSRVESHAGSSSSSPGPQVRGRRLTEDDLNVAYDPRPEVLKVYNPPRMNSRVSERNAYYHPTLSHASADIPPHYYRSPPMPPTIDPTVHPTRLSPLPPAIRHPYALPIQHCPSHIPGHTSPTYMGSRPPSGAGTPPYTVYSPYQAPYGYHVPWDILIQPRPGPGYSPSLLQGEYNLPSPQHPSFFYPPFSSVTDSSSNTQATQNVRSHENSHSRSPSTMFSRSMVFGSVGLPSDDVDQAPDGNGTSDKEGVNESVVQVVDQLSGFGIGIMPGEPTRGNRKRSTKSHSRPSASPGAESVDNLNAINDAPQYGQKVADERVACDIAVSGKKWEFGTTATSNSIHADGPLEDLQSTSLESPANPVQPVALLPDTHTSVAIPSTQPPGSAQPVTPSSEAGPSILNSEDSSSTSDVWVVKNYGYGFGDVNGTDKVTDIIRRTKEGQVEHALKQQQEEHVWQEAHDEGEVWDQGREFGRGRPRRGSWTASYGPHERGGYGGRRSRGVRYPGRYHDRGGHQQPPISLTPPPQFNPLPLPDYLNGYVPQMSPYPDYGLYHPAIPVIGGPPIPMPQSALPFPLDTTRSCLLGQLEYYLSPQNMAQDFFLRQRMDDQGWIPISLIASFNRVKQLTTEVQVVRDVLNLSSLTEVKGDYVRMASERWKQFVLPTAPRSTVCHRSESEPTETREVDQADAHAQDGEIEEGDTYADDEEEEEDIVFVIGEEAEGSWAPERRPTVTEKN